MLSGGGGGERRGQNEVRLLDTWLLEKAFDEQDTFTWEYK